MLKKLFLFILIYNLTHGQTEIQKKQALDFIKKSGLDNEQIKKIAKTKGYSNEQIDQVLKKEKQNKNSNNLNNDNYEFQKIPLEKANNSPVKSEGKEILSNDKENLLVIDEPELAIIDDSKLESKKSDQIKVGLEYFGYDIFKKDPALFQEAAVGAIDPDYLIGPGDEIIVMLWGQTQFRQVLNVNREGFIFIPEIGQVFVNGLNMNLLEAKLFRVLSQSYASLNPIDQKATTFLDVSLGNLRPLRVQVLGEVAQPGAFTMSPTASLFSSLYYFKGPTYLGSLRDIHLIRGEKKVTSIDFYDFLLTGKKPKDVKLQLDDVIFIPKRLKTVSIDGEVNRPGIYELKNDETFSDILSMAGGLKVTAYLDRAQIDRVVPFNQRKIEGMDRMFTDLNLNDILYSKEKFLLQDGDRIMVFSIMDLRQNTVTLQGAVSRPGIYDLGDSMKLSELIDKADGLLGDAFLDRVDVVRIKSDFTEQLIKLNLSEVMNRAIDDDIYLNSLDNIKVYSITEMIPKTYVSINGHVKTPGSYPLQENMTLFDLIFKAGGYIDEEFKKLTYLKRAELIRVRPDSDIKEIIPFDLGMVLKGDDVAKELLRPDDAVNIYSIDEVEGATRYVSISGHVKTPGKYELYQGKMTLYDLIFRAGGFEDKIFKQKTFLERAELIRNSIDGNQKKIIPFNLGLVLQKQGLADSILQADDFIRIYSVDDIIGSERYVLISGHVKKPGKYELFEENMSIYDLVFRSGGFDDPEFRGKTFLERADLIRFNKDRINKKIIPFNLENVLNDPSKKYNFRLQPGDEIKIYSRDVFNTIKSTYIDGVIRAPGRYELKEKMTIKDLILEAGGLSEDIYKYKIEVSRIDPMNEDENKYAEIIELEMLSDFSLIDVKYDFNENSSDFLVNRDDFLLEPYDFISIRPDPFFNMQKTVTVKGAVYFPGTYVINSPSETISDIIKRAGGPSPNAFLFGSKFVRNSTEINIDLKKIIRKRKSKLDLNVYDGDEILIARRPNLVFVSGESNAPGAYKFNKSFRIKDLISASGGLSPNADKSNIYIKYANGVSRNYSRWLKNHKVLDGSELVIGAKEPGEPFDVTEFSKEIASILADFAQVAAIITVAFRN